MASRASLLSEGVGDAPLYTLRQDFGRNCVEVDRYHPIQRPCRPSAVSFSSSPSSSAGTHCFTGGHRMPNTLYPLRIQYEAEQREATLATFRLPAEALAQRADEGSDRPSDEEANCSGLIK